MVIVILCVYCLNNLITTLSKVERFNIFAYCLKNFCYHLSNIAKQGDFFLFHFRAERVFL